MKKKFLYVIMTLVFAVCLCAASTAVLSTSDAVSLAGSVSEGEQVTVSDNAAEGESINVSASVTAANIQALASGWTKVPSGTLPNGVAASYGYYKNFGYSGSSNTSGTVQYEDLPAGTYLLEAWGASGGNDGNQGGHGGYMRAIYKLSTATRIYIAVGGVGTSSASNAAGGWNGGGKAGSYGSSGGGGGATHFATATGTLNSLKSNKGAVLLVAGGGGGAGNVSAGSYHNRGYGGLSPQPNSANTAISRTDTYFGLGEACMTSGNNDGGGGGGGYYGGRGAVSDSWGGGGLSYYNPGTAGYFTYVSGAVGVNGNAEMPHPTTYTSKYTKGTSTGQLNGYARITCLNNPPTSAGAVLTATYRGGNTTMTPSQVANDAGSYHTTRSWAETNRVYTNSACTTLVSSDVLAVSGMTANATGTVTLTPKRFFTNTVYYVKVRDDMGFVTTVSFTLSVTDRNIAARSGVTSYVTGSAGQYRYYVGNSSTTDVNTFDPNNTNSVVYNPNGQNRYTVFIPKPITQGETALYINAADLFTDADSTTYDDIVITSVTNASTSAYTIAMNSADYKYGRGYSRVSIRHNGAAQSQGFISTVRFTVQSVEKATNTLMGSAATIEVIFKIDNTRPTLKQSDPYYVLDVGDTVQIKVSDICVDGDLNRNEIKQVKVPTNEFVYLDIYGRYLYTSLNSSSNYYFTEAQNAATANSLSSTAEGTRPLSFEKSGIVDSSADSSRSYLTYTIDPEGQYINITGLRATRNQYPAGDSGRVGDFYFMVRVEDKGDPTDMGIWYPIAVKVNNTRPVQVQPAAIADTASTDVATDEKGNKVMYFSPMGLGVLTPDEAVILNDNNHIKGVAEDADNFTVSADGVTHTDSEKSKVYNEFLVFDKSQFGTPTAEYPYGKIENEFYRIEPVPLYAHAASAAKIAGSNPILAGPTDDVGWERYDEWNGDITLYQGSDNIISFYGIKVTFLRSTGGVYLQQPIVVKDTRGASNSATASVGGNLNGLVNLLIRADNNPVEMLTAAEIQAGSSDKILARREYKDKDSGLWEHRERSVTVNANVSASGSLITYTVPNGFTFEITPYDLARDIDMADGWIPGENTNTAFTFQNWTSATNADVNSGVYALGANYQRQLDAAHSDRSGLYYTTNPLQLSTKPASLKLDRLYFDGSAQVTNASGGLVTDVTNDETKLSYVKVETTGRTSQTNPFTFRVKISDGASSRDVTVQVIVTDNLPELRTEAKNVFYLSSNYMGLNADTTNSSNDFIADTYQGASSGKNLFDYAYNVREFRPNDLAEDFEPDTLYFADANITFYTLTKIAGVAPVRFDGVDYYRYNQGSTYLDAEFAQATGGRSGQVLRLTARSSTQMIAGGLFVGINITDNYGFDSNANVAHIIFQVEVLNSAPQVNRDTDTGFNVIDKRTEGENRDPSTDTSSYEWSITPNDISEVNNTYYYIASSMTVYNALIANGESTKNIRLLTQDNDLEQSLYLYAGKEAEGMDNLYTNIPVYGIDNNTNRNPGGSIKNDMAMLFTLPGGDSYNINLATLLYYDASGNGLESPYEDYTQSSNPASILAAARRQGYVGNDITLRYVDNPNWAVRIKPTSSFAQPMRITLRVRDSQDTSRDKENAYFGKRSVTDGVSAAGTAQIDSYEEMTVYFNMGSLGMTEPHEKYPTFYEYVDGEGRTHTTDFEYNGIPLTTAGATIPLSYFAYTASLPTASTQVTSAVSFNGAYFENSTPAQMLERVSLTDGTNVWSGATLNDNPFLQIEVSANRLQSVTAFGYTNGYLNEDLRLDGESSISDKIYENFQAINLKLRGPRSASPLKLTLDLALYEGVTGEGTPKITIDDNTGLPVISKVTLDVVMPNSPMSILDSSTVNSQQIFELDTGASIPQGDVSAYTFKLFDSAVSQPSSARDIINVRYSDLNYLRTTTGMTPAVAQEHAAKYRDSVRFLFSSLGTSGAVLTKDQLNYMVSVAAGGLQNTGATERKRLEEFADYLGVPYTNSDSPTQIATRILELTNTVNGISLLADGDPEETSPTEPEPTEPTEPDPTEPHTHTYAQVWSSDETNHWHIADCDPAVDADCATATTTPEPHSFTSGTCTVCGYIDPTYGQTGLALVNPNLGHEEYFTIDAGSDSDSFTIRPIKKTSLDYTSAPGFNKAEAIGSTANVAAVKAYALEKHLVAEFNGQPASGSYSFYFPLKVIVYDTYAGTGFLESTWQLLTIKVRINNSNPEVNSSLYASGRSYYEIAVTTEDDYVLNIADVIVDRDFVRMGSRYQTADELVDRNASDYLVLDRNNGTSSYPYANVADSTSSPASVWGYANYKVTATQGSSVYRRASLIPYDDRIIDVEIGYDSDSGAPTEIRFRANRRVTSERTYLVLRFADNHGAFVDFHVLAQVSNKAPELLKEREPRTLAGTKLTTTVYDNNGAPNITMKTGDSFDIVVAPFDMFKNDLSAAQSANFNPSSPNNDAFGAKVNYENIENANVDGGVFITDSTGDEYVNTGKNTYLGRYVIAEDDAPSTLRINPISTAGLNNKITVTPQNIYTASNGNNNYLSYHVEANGVVNKLPLTVTVSDGPYSVSVIFTITVVSTPPKVDFSRDDELEEKGINHELLGENDDIGEKAAELGVTETDLSSGIVFSVRMKMGDKPYVVNLNDLCSDPDTGDNDSMYLYSAFAGSPFSVGGNANGVTESAYAKLDPIVGSDGRSHSFSITPKNFMSGGDNGLDKKFEQIVFYVMDANGQTLEHAQKIIMNIYIDPASLTSTSDDPSNPNGNTKTFYSFEVKSKAEYNAADADDKPSRLTVVTPSAQAARAGTQGLVIDPDYGASNTAYSISVYAMLKAQTSADGSVTGWQNMSRSVADFARENVDTNNRGYTPYELKRFVYDPITGVMVTETSRNINNDLYMYVESYFEFDFSADGATINFTPINTTIAGEIPLYVTIQKRNVPDNPAFKSDAYFAVSVGNSTPTATAESAINNDVYGDDSFLEFNGSVGDSRVYTIHDKNDQAHGLFADLDTNDTVTLNTRRGNGTGWEILPSYNYGDGVVNTNPDWEADTARQLGRAINVTRTQDGNGLSVQFMRKIDVNDTTSAEFIRLPMRVYGIDSRGGEVYNDIILVIHNSTPEIRDWELEDDEKRPKVNYTLVSSSSDTYLLEATIERGKPLTIRIADIYRDPDTNSTTEVATSICDTVNFVGDASRGYLSDISGRTQAFHSVGALGEGNTELFRISSPNANNSTLVVECTSYSRGSVGQAVLRIADNSGAAAKDIILRFTVANTAPMAKPNAPTVIDLFGSEGTENNEGILVTEDSVFNILDFVTDLNPSDTLRYYEGAEEVADTTYLNIIRVERGRIDDGEAKVIIEPTVESGVSSNVNVFNADKAEDNPQQFYIRPIAGVYGWQYITITVSDNGGKGLEYPDSLTYDIRIRFNIAYGGSATEGIVTNQIGIARGRSSVITMGDVLDRYVKNSDTGADELKEYSNGYVLKGFDITGQTGRLEVLENPLDNGGTSYGLKVLPAAQEGSTLKVTAKCAVGSLEKDVTFNVLVGVNEKPTLKSDFGTEVSYKFNSAQESRDDKWIHLPASFFFNDDIDIDVLKIVSAESAIKSILEVDIHNQNGVNEVMLNFKANREVMLTLGVIDETEEIVKVDILVCCPDKNDLGFFAAAMIYVRSNPLLFAIILGSLLLLLIILLIIILTVRKKRKMRKEIEALLVSEMEMEEQMLKLSAGQQTNAYYNSFGYLPPTQQTPNAPLLGQGGPTTTGAVPPSNAIGLNPGESSGNGKNGDGFDGENF